MAARFLACERDSLSLSLFLSVARVADATKCVTSLKCQWQSLSGSGFPSYWQSNLRFHDFMVQRFPDENGFCSFATIVLSGITKCRVDKKYRVYEYLERAKSAVETRSFTD